MAQLPNPYKAVIDIQKLSEYCLNPFHPTGKHKAKGFTTQLGIKQGDAEWLKAQILEKITEAEAQPQFEDAFGKRYGVDLLIKNGHLEAIIRTAWIVKWGEEFPRLLTCYVKSN